MRRIRNWIVPIAAAVCLTAPAVASAQDQYLGEVRLFGTPYCPAEWLPADGRTVSVNTYVALFSLYSTMYGGDGRTTFGLPNLIGRAPVSQGANMGATFVQGQNYGGLTTTLSASQLPAHTHPLNGTSGGTASNSPAGALLPVFPTAQHIYSATTASADTAMNAGAVGPNTTSAPQAVPTESPVQTLQWCVAVVGLYPTRP